MATTTASALDERLSKLIGDWIEAALTTALTTSTSVVSTNFNAYDNASNNTFNNRWVYVTNYANATADRLIYDYVTSGGTCSVRGANFVTDGSNLATVRISRHGYTKHLEAINDAIRAIYPILYRPIEDRTLITGNVLPDNSFELWISSSNPSLYSGTNATLARTTTAGLIRGAVGTTSILVSASAADGYAYISSDTFPRLLDLQGKSITIAAHAYPSTANDAFMDVVYTLAGTSTTVSTTTACGASRFTLLKRESIAIPDDIEKIEFRFRVHTSGETAYFDSARVTGPTVYEHLLLSDFADGDISRVSVQTSGNASDICDDLHPGSWDDVYGWSTYNDGTYEWLRLPYAYGDKRQIRIIGTAPLSTLSAFDDTTEVDGSKVDLLLAYAAYYLFRNVEGTPSSQDTARYTKNQYKWLNEYERLKPMIRMMRPTGSLNLPTQY